MKSVKESDVAKRAGVSRATVSRVLHRDARVQPETARRVIEAAHALNYQNTRRRTVGVLIYRECEIYSYLAMALSRLRREIARRNWHMELFSVEDLSLLNERSVNGVVNLSHAAELNDFWGETVGLPLVNFYTPSRHSEQIYSVCTDGADVMKKCVDYLWRNGHRRIGFLSDESRETEERRTSGCWSAFLREMALRNGEAVGAFRYSRSVRREIETLLKQNITAVIVTNERFGPEAARWVQVLGKRIPDDISLITHESTEVSRYLSPPHTTILQDYDGMAVQALDMLERMMRNLAPSGDAALPGSLIVRESVTKINH